MRVWAIAASVLLLTACARTAPAALTEFRDSERGFTIRRPQTWTEVRRGDGVWFIPGGADEVPEAAEFILVVTRPSAGRLDDPAIRRAVFELLPIHGVSGFQQDARTTDQVLWYKFEVTGSSGGQEWASVGVVAAGQTRYHIVVCATPLPRWRDGQKQCDQVVKTFQPGDLNE